MYEQVRAGPTEAGGVGAPAAGDRSLSALVWVLPMEPSQAHHQEVLRSGFSLATSAWPPHTGLGSLPPEGMSLMMFVLSRAHRLTHSGRVLFLYFLVIFLCFYVICVMKASVALEIQIHLAQTEGRIANKMEPPGRASLCSSWSLS